MHKPRVNMLRVENRIRFDACPGPTIREGRVRVTPKGTENNKYNKK